MRTACLLVLLGACKTVYDAQYDDRATELEAFRSVFQPGEANVQFISASQNKFYWVATDPQTSAQRLHSFDPVSMAKIDYSFDINASDFTKFNFSDSLLAICDFSTQLFDMTTPGGGSLPSISEFGSPCAVDGNTIYYAHGNMTGDGQALWSSQSGSAPTQIMDFQPMFMDDMAVDGMGLTEPGQLVLDENGNIWHVDAGAHTAQFLHNPKTGNGAFAFDATRVVYPTADSVVYQGYNEENPHDVLAAIKDGGYSLNFEHGDVQDLDPETDDYWLAQDHLIYRSKHGIFALGLDTGKVVDLLLNRDGEFEPKPFYEHPTPVANTLFAQDLSFDGDHPVYAVDVSGRLR